MHLNGDATCFHLFQALVGIIVNIWIFLPKVLTMVTCWWHMRWAWHILEITISKRWRRSLPTEKSSLHIQPTARNPRAQRQGNWGLLGITHLNQPTKGWLADKHGKDNIKSHPPLSSFSHCELSWVKLLRFRVCVMLWACLCSVSTNISTLTNPCSSFWQCQEKWCALIAPCWCEVQCFW